MSGDGDRLDQVLAEYLLAAESGQAPDRAELLRQHPDLAERLAAYFADEDGFRQLVTPAAKAEGNTVSFVGQSNGEERHARAESAGKIFGSYEIIEEIAAGGMGVVYKAKQAGAARTVALKMLHGRFSSAHEVRRFCEEAERISGLEHPHIVPIYDVGDIDGQPFFSMKLMEGGSLRNRDDEFRGNLRAAAALLAQVARAVHFAHQRGILHCDLKPANVLLDRHGVPYVSDFGLSKPLTEHPATDEPSVTGSIEGTPAYMSPEQSRGVRRLTTATDVYGLGAVLYHVLTGRPPFVGRDLLSILGKVTADPPDPPRALNSHVERDLEIVCLKCLAKEPADRYPSADELAKDLDRWLAGEPIKARRASMTERAWRWGRRHPLISGLSLTAAALLLILIAGVFSVARARQAQLVTLTSRKNAADARHVASTVLLRLQAIAAFVEEAANDPHLRQLLKEGDSAGLHAFCHQLEGRGELREALRAGDDDPLASWMVLDASGTLLAVSHGDGVLDPHLPGRDYFRGAVPVGHDRRTHAHISRAYLSENQQIYKFGITSPVRDPDADDKLLGVVGVTLATGASLGSRLVEGDQQVVLALPVDDEPPHQPRIGRNPPTGYLIVVHPAYHPRQEPLRLPAGILPLHLPRPGNELQLVHHEAAIPPLDDYRDPARALDARYDGRWLAGFAPVGNTEFVVIVQEPYAAVMSPDRVMLRQLFFWLAMTLAVGAASTVVLFIVRARAVRRSRNAVDFSLGGV